MVVRELSAMSPAALLAAVLALASVGAHGWMLATMPASFPIHLLVLVTAAACLWCAVRLLRAPRVHGWVATAVMGAAMVGVHLVIGGTGHEMTGMTHGPGVTAPMVAQTHAGATAMTAALGIALAELGVAVAVLWRLGGRPAHPPTSA